MNTYFCVETVHHNNHRITITALAVRSDALPESTAICGENYDTYKDYFNTEAECTKYIDNCIASADKLHIELFRRTE